MSFSRRLLLVGFTACLPLPLAGCGQVTYILQQYDGPVRSPDTVSVLRVQPDDPAQIVAMDGEDLAPQSLASDVRLHIEMLPGKHKLSVKHPGVRGLDTRQVEFVAKAGRTYRVLLSDRDWHATAVEPQRPDSWSPLVYEVHAGNNRLLQEVSLPPSGS